MAHEKSLTKEMRQCIENCQDCSTICLETVHHCLTLGSRHAEAHHILLLMNCASICRTTAEFMLSGSEHHMQLCGVCADVCADCAKDCRTIGGSDETMRKCAEMCERCAESCHAMAGAHAAAR